MERFRPTRAVIHLDNLVHNVKELRRALGPLNPFFCPMVKANAYGHGDAEIALKLDELGVLHLGVGLIEEGVFLREKGVRSQLVFFGIFDEKGAKTVVENGLLPVLSTWEQIRALESIVKTPLAVHLKFDTGMHRLGFSLTELKKLFDYFSSSKKFKVEGILTHLHTGEDAFDLKGASFDQLRLFQNVIRTFNPLKPISHTLNSAGLLHFLEHHQGRELPDGIPAHQGVRPGLALYGIPPVRTRLSLKPVMSLRSETVRYHFVRKGEGVSYNRTWKAPVDSVIAVVPMGYADGYHRALSNQAEALFRGQRVPLVGNVCMDYLMIDVTRTLHNEIADHLRPEMVTLFGHDQAGNELSASELARKASTITWEILTSVGVRVPREVGL